MNSRELHALINDAYARLARIEALWNHAISQCHERAQEQGLSHGA